MKINRRDFLKLLGLQALSSTSCAKSSSFIFSTEDFEINKVNIAIKDLKDEFVNYKIGFLSDIHLGPYITKSYLKLVLEALYKLKPDILLLGGDYINLPEDNQIRRNFGVVRDADYDYNKYSLKLLSKKVFFDLSNLINKFKFKDGVYAVYGNHDRWANKNDCMYYFEKSGIRILKNNYISIERNNAKLEVVGVDDYWTGVPNLSKSIPKLDKNSVKILLNHNPDYITVQEKLYGQEFDLILGGHSHGGQIRLPFVGALVTNVEDRNFAFKLNKLGKTYCYTSNGLGVVEIPYRLNCKPEANIFVLQKK